MNISRDFNYSNSLVDLKFFSAIPPGTDIHKDRNGQFIITASTISSIPGAQTLANYCKGHTPEKLAVDIDTFAKELITHLWEEVREVSQTSNEKLKARTFENLVQINREITQAVNGVEEEGGLLGLVKTHEGNQAVCSLLNGTIDYMQKSAFSALSDLNDSRSVKEFTKEDLGAMVRFQSPQDRLPYCPEEAYCDEDWEKAIVVSENLKEECVSLLKYYGNYSSALAYNNMMSLYDGLKTSTQEALGIEQDPSYNWWDKIQTFDNNAALYLGALPLCRGAFGYTQRNDLEAIKALGVGAILSVVEVFENKAEGIVTSPIKPSEWKAAGIKQLQLPSPDFKTMPLEFVQRGVEFIHWNISNGRSVYVHCKAGRGRSALIEMCYLIKHHGYSADDAFALIKSMRKQAGFSKKDPKMATLKEFEARCKPQGEKL